MTKKRGRKTTRKSTRKSRVPKIKKNPNLALVLELVPGFFGILGVGHFYNGSIRKGFMFLLGYLFYLLFGIVVLTVTYPFGTLLIVPVGIAIYFWALIDVHDEALRINSGKLKL